MKNKKTEREKLRNKRTSYVSKGRFKKITIVEAISLQVTGLLDGKRGLPREEEDGMWSSPHTDSEKNAFLEFCTKLWGILQLESTSDFAELNTRVNKLLQSKSDLKDEEARLEEKQETLQPLDYRKKGEETLTDNQIRSRRNRENELRLAPTRRKIEALRQSIGSQVEELSELYSQILEDINTTRLVCTRLKDHTMQRLDIYWHKALKNHPKSTNMPVTPPIILTSTAEDDYITPHKELIQQVEQLVRVTHDDMEEAA